jgi:hypothetical protein
MSHSVNIKTQFKNIQTLLNQFKKLGWSIDTDIKCNTYYSDPRKEEVHQYVAKNPSPGGFDVGINTDADGNTFFVCDFYDRSIEKQLGPNLKNVKQGYALDEIKKSLQEEDMHYQVSELPSGELVLIAEK